MATKHQQNWQQSSISCNSDELFLGNCETIRAVGLWAADLLGLTKDDAAAYSQALVGAFIRPGPFDIVETLQADFRAKGLDVSEHRITAVAEREREVAFAKIALSKAPGKGTWERRRFPRAAVPPPSASPALKAWQHRHR